MRYELSNPRLVNNNYNVKAKTPLQAAKKMFTRFCKNNINNENALFFFTINGDNQEFDFQAVKKGDNIKIKRIDIPEDGNYRIINQLNNSDFFNNNSGDLEKGSDIYFYEPFRYKNHWYVEYMFEHNLDFKSLYFSYAPF